MFKECLKYNIVPFIIEDNLKMYYYRGLKEWDNENIDIIIATSAFARQHRIDINSIWIILK